MKREAKFNTTFNHWLKNVYKKTGVFELKQTRTNSLPFNSVVEHQRQALLQVRHGTFVYKIVDCGFQNPMDCFCMTEQPSFVVISYHKRGFVGISIDTFLLEEKRSKRKSLVWSRAVDLASFVVK